LLIMKRGPIRPFITFVTLTLYQSNLMSFEAFSREQSSFLV
jgi:hypothetical protein